MKKLPFILRDSFGFSQTEVRGTIVLTICILALLIVPLLLKYFFISPNYSTAAYQEDVALLNRTMANLEKQKQVNDSLQVIEKEENKEKNKEKYNLAYANNSTENSSFFAFDPNQISVNQWKSLGLKPYLAERIEKYRSKGGKFKIKSDLQKIYGFPEDLYKRLYAYIQLPESLTDSKVTKEYKQEKSTDVISENFPKKEYSKKGNTLQTFDINTADTAQLKQIRGIGAVISERIVKFRNSVGGFHSLEQVKEVYGIKDEVYQELSKYALMSKGFEVKKININTATLDLLKAHPYIGYKNAQIIINYRNQHGNYTSADDLLKTKVIDQTQVEKLKPYLVF
jgi:competence protein ComEA